RAGCKALDDRLDRLDLVDLHRWHWRGRRCELEEPAQRCAVAVLIVDELRVLLEDRVLTASRGVLQLENGVGAEQVVFAVPPPLVLAARLELQPSAGIVERAAVPAHDFFGNDIDADPADA